MSGTEHPLVTDYLAAVERGAAALPAARRDELIADLREHLALALKGHGDRESVRAVLERLGSPTVIAEAALAEESASAPSPASSQTSVPSSTPSSSRSRKVITAVLLGSTGLAGLGGSFAATVVLLCGLTLLWTSGQWQRGNKLLVTALVIVTPAVLVVGTAIGTLSRWGTPMGLLTLMTAGVLLPGAAAVRLLRS